VNPKLEGGGCCRSSSEVESACAADMPTLNAPLKHDDRSVRCQIRSSEKTLTAKRFALDASMDNHSVMQASFSAPPYSYRSALQLARSILLGANIDHAERLGGQTFTLSLSRIWGDAVAQMCRDLEPQTVWRVEPESIRLWDDASGTDDK